VRSWSSVAATVLAIGLLSLAARAAQTKEELGAKLWPKERVQAPSKAGSAFDYKRATLAGDAGGQQ
jgi:hypothetical protein